jgi:hypothetical protein
VTDVTPVHILAIDLLLFLPCVLFPYIYILVCVDVFGQNKETTKRWNQR